MKVKIFANTNPQLLEEGINEWLLKNEHIKIKNTLQSSLGDREYNYTVISIWYKEKK